MVTTESLLKLIHSISNTDKERFIKESEGQSLEQPQYLKLFQLIAFDKNISIEEIRNQAQKKLKITGLSDVQNYLFNRLLEFITNIPTGSNEEIIEGEIKKIQALLKRGLYQESHELLLKTKALCDEHEISLLKCKILELEYRIEYTLNPQKFKNFYDKLINATMNETLKHLNLLKYRKNYAVLVSFYANERLLKGKSTPAELKEVVTDSTFTNKSLAKTFKTKVLFYNAQMCYANLSSDFIKEYKMGEELLQLWHSHPEKMQQYKIAYFEVLLKQIIVSLYLQKFDNFNALYKKFNGFSFVVSYEKTLLHIYQHYIEITICLLKGDVKNAERLVKKFKDAYEDYYKETSNHTHLIRLELLFAQVYFISGDYKMVYKHIQFIQDNYAQNKNSEIYAFTKIFNLIIEYETNKMVNLEYSLRNTKYYFQKYNELNFLESCLVKMIKNLFNAYSHEEKINVLKETKNELKKNMDNSTLYSLSFGLDIYAWIESKILNKPMPLILDEKSKSQYPDIFKLSLVL